MDSVIHGLVSVVVLFVLALVVLGVVACWKIVQKAGYPGWWVLISLVPGVGAVFFFLFAFSDWPVLKRLRRLENGSAGPPHPGESASPPFPRGGGAGMDVPRPAITRPDARTIAVLSLGVLYFAVLFSAWNSASTCFPDPLGGAPYCVSLGSQTGWAGLGFIPGLLIIGLLAWEGLSWGGALAPVGPVVRAFTAPGLAVAIALFTLLRVLTNLGGVTVAAWLGFVVSAGLAAATVIRWRDAGVPQGNRKLNAGGTAFDNAGPPEHHEPDARPG